MLVLGRRHLERVLRAYAAHYNGEGRIEASGSRRRSHGRALLGGQPKVTASGRTTCWAG
ncbi:MAG TPA: hypothetical protein VE915_02615 [Actinomycetota bacterium]|jgi:hypothetical protein|nr:hypothetical protein [Actinomycetota bacterium]